jgi:hypothetical protein
MINACYCHSNWQLLLAREGEQRLRGIARDVLLSSCT